MHMFLLCDGCPRCDVVHESIMTYGVEPIEDQLDALLYATTAVPTITVQQYADALHAFEEEEPCGYCGDVNDPTCMCRKCWDEMQGYPSIDDESSMHYWA